MRRLAFYLLIGLAIVLIAGAGYTLGWQQRSWAERASLRENTCLARYFDGQSEGITWVYVGDAACREIIARTGAKPPVPYKAASGS